MKKVAVLASGRGSNFQAVIDSVESGEIPACCSGLITDNPRASAIMRAEKAGIPVYLRDYSSYSTKESYEEALCSAMEECGADLFVLAGYMRILGSGIVRRFPGRMINIHPALLPSFSGLHAQRQALEYGVRVAGCTVHFVDEGMDSGPIILQSCVSVLDSDDEEALAERILAEEHKVLPRAIALFCQDRLRIVGRKVKIL
jgi:phosphoribosylglycinamide formyltransferase-1